MLKRALKNKRLIAAIAVGVGAGVGAFAPELSPQARQAVQLVLELLAGG